MSEVPTGREAARRRHPSARWVAPIAPLRERVVTVLDLHGVRHPEVASILLEVRGRTGLGIEAFAARVGVTPDVVGQAEHGLLGPRQLPAALRAALS